MNGYEVATSLPDADLNELHRLVRNERQATARLVAVLGEVDARQLYLAVQRSIQRVPRDVRKTSRGSSLLRRCVPTGDLAAIFDRALPLPLHELHRTKHGIVTRPRVVQLPARGRHIPAAVRRAVWDRDCGQCTFVGSMGRCAERGFLEYHHVVPFAEADRPRSRMSRCVAAASVSAIISFCASGARVRRAPVDA
jgi:hypothetical protein